MVPPGLAFPSQGVPIRRITLEHVGCSRFHSKPLPTGVTARNSTDPATGVESHSLSFSGEDDSGQLTVGKLSPRDSTSNFLQWEIVQECWLWGNKDDAE